MCFQLLTKPMQYTSSLHRWNARSYCCYRIFGRVRPLTKRYFNRRKCENYRRYKLKTFVETQILVDSVFNSKVHWKLAGSQWLRFEVWKNVRLLYTEIRGGCSDDNMRNYVFAKESPHTYLKSLPKDVAAASRQVHDCCVIWNRSGSKSKWLATDSTLLIATWLHLSGFLEPGTVPVQIFEFKTRQWITAERMKINLKVMDTGNVCALLFQVSKTTEIYMCQQMFCCVSICIL